MTNTTKTTKTEKTAKGAKTNNTTPVAEVTMQDVENTMQALMINDPIFEELVVTVNDEHDDIQTKWAKVYKLACEHVDETQLAPEYCSNGELNRRIRLLQTKKTLAKKANNMDEYAQIEEEEAMLKTYRTTPQRTSSIVSTENVDFSKLSQEELQKVIRNFQSKKSAAKKAADNDGVQHWQNMVDEASKYRATAASKVKVVNKQVQELIDTLKTLPESPEVTAQIEKLQALL